MDHPLYIYAFCDAPLSAPALTGLDERPVSFIESGGIYAAVSAAPEGRLRPQRRLLSAHQAVLAQIAKSVSTLPSAFGLVADDAATLREAMGRHAMRLRSELERIDGCLEMEVKLSWATDRVFEHLVSIDEHLRAMRDELVALGESAPHDLKVNVGRQVEAVLASHRADAEHRLLSGLVPVSRELQGQPPTDEGDLARVVALVERGSLEAFEHALAEVASGYDESHVFRLAGPFAPHSFVELQLDLAAQAA